MGQRYLESSLIQRPLFRLAVERKESFWREEIVTSQEHHAGTLHVRAWSTCRFEKERKACVLVVSNTPAEVFQCMWRANYEAESVVGYFRKYTKSPAPNDHFTFRKALQTSFFFVNFGPLPAFRNPELCTAWQRNFRTHGSNSLSLLISSFSLLFFHIFVCFLVFFFSVSFHCR